MCDDTWRGFSLLKCMFVALRMKRRRLESRAAHSLCHLPLQARCSLRPSSPPRSWSEVPSSDHMLLRLHCSHRVRRGGLGDLRSEVMFLATNLKAGNQAPARIASESRAERRHHRHRLLQEEGGMRCREHRASCQHPLPGSRHCSRLAHLQGDGIFLNSRLQSEAPHLRINRHTPPCSQPRRLQSSLPPPSEGQVSSLLPLYLTILCSSELHPLLRPMGTTNIHRTRSAPKSQTHGL